MNKKVKKAIIISSISAIFVSTFLIVRAVTKNGKEYDLNAAEVKDAYNYLKETLEGVNKDRVTYFEYVDGKSVNYFLNDIVSENTSRNVTENFGYEEYYKEKNPAYTVLPNVNSIEYGDKLVFTINIDSGKEGLYYISLDYNINGDSLNNPTLSVKVNNQVQYVEQTSIDIPIIWEGTEEYEDGTKSFDRDTFGDEIIPINNRVEGWQNFLFYDNQQSSSSPLMFELVNGANEIEIECISTNVPILIGELRAVAPTKTLTYKEYREQNSLYSEQKGIVKKNSIYYHQKNSSYISLYAENSPSVSPYTTKRSKLNIFNGDSWNKAGQEVSYTINVPTTGYYKIAFHYANTKQEYNIFRSISINGKVPFKELENYEFKSTDIGKWANHTLNDGDEDYLILLNKGDNLLSIKAQRNHITPLVDKIQLVIDHINYFALEILRITGNDIDKSREYRLTETIKETEDYLESYDILIKSIVMEAKNYSTKKTASSTLSYLQKAIVTLNKLQKKADDLPKYLTSFYSGSSSINQMLGDTINTLNAQPFSLDYIYIYGGKVTLPRANASIWEKFKTSVIKLFNSFFDKKYDQKNDRSMVNVWVSRPLTYINIMQTMVDREFNNNPDYTGPKIRLISMPDASKLILANAAGENPDVALGIGSHMPFDLAIRGAAYDLTQFSGGNSDYSGNFYEVATRFAPGTLVPFNLDQGFYALPETLDFNVLMYRKDILNSFNIKVPQTWDDVIGILTSLQRYGMNFYMPISATNATKWFYQTSPLIYQNGGKLYSDDAITTTISSPESVKGLKLLTDLFKNYALPAQVPSFYNSFRYGTIPVGIAGFGDYLQMKNAAPELVGKWDIDLPIGTSRVDENGDAIIDRTFISNGSAAMIFKSTNKAEASWEFLSWWTHQDTQVEFANTLQSTYGPEYVWMSSNLNAVRESALDSRAKSIILGTKDKEGALDYIIDIPRTPGQYMLERGISNIWSNVVFYNTPIRAAIDQQITLINREMRRKLIEFGYLSSNGDIIKNYNVHEKDWVVALLAQKVGGK